MTHITETNTSLRIARMFSAMRESVFRAWTDPAQLKMWWHIDGNYAPSVAEVDLRVGGRFRLGMISPGDGQERVCTGVFKAIDASQNLAYTWQWEDESPPHETHVEIDFFDHGKNTEVLVTHSGFRSKDECDEHAHLWNGCLSQLAALLHEIETPPIELCITIQAPEEKVFQALTVAHELERWFPTKAENDPVPGGRFTFEWDFPDAPASNHMRCGEYTEVIPYKTVSHTWDARPKRDLTIGHGELKDTKPTVVEFRLTPHSEDPNVTRLMLIHSGWESGREWDELKESHLRGWTFFLGNLKTYLETGHDDRTREMGMRITELA